MAAWRPDACCAALHVNMCRITWCSLALAAAAAGGPVWDYIVVGAGTGPAAFAAGRS